MKSRILLSSFVFTLGVLAAIVQPVSAAVACPTVMAHRGNAYFGSPIENSLNAFSASYAAGAKWVETDMHFTSDNVPVLMHDSTVDRTTTGTGAIAQKTVAQFTALTMDDGQHPPTFDQLLALVQSNSANRAIVEVKTTLTAAQEQVVLSKLQGLEDRVYLNGFSARLSSLQHLKAANPALHTSLLTYSPVLPIPAGIEGEDMEYTYITSANVAQLHNAGAVVRAWVPNSATNWSSLRTSGVDGIMTNKTTAYMDWANTTCPVTNPDPDPEPEPTPTEKEFVTNQGFEANLTGWGKATTASQNTRITGGYVGGYALRSVNNSSAKAKTGFMSSPSWINGESGKAANQGSVYTASAWVKPDFVGQHIAIYLKETNPSTNASFGSKTITLTAN
jgi:glycerophosphoryl diester phosphodiesterase